MVNTKGQGLSLNVIIIAALALIVLVVLVAIFLGRVGIFGDDLSKQGNSELALLKIGYGDCHPTGPDADNFVEKYNGAESDEQGEQFKSDFSARISECKALSNDKGACEAGGCSWK